MKTYLHDEQLSQPNKILNNEKEKRSVGDAVIATTWKKIHSNKTEEMFVEETGPSGYVKVNFDGLLNGRNADLNDHDFCENFAQTL